MSANCGGSNGRGDRSPQVALFDEIGDPLERREHDFYPTPPWQTRALLKRVPVHGRVLECCAGMGDMSRVLMNAAGVKAVYINEPYQPIGPCPLRLDATQAESWRRFPAVDWVITNPPFNLSHLIVPLALAHARTGVAMLLRLSWFEPTEERQDFLEAHPPVAIITMPRHKYRGTGSGDSVTTGWFVWLADEGIRQYGRRPFRNDTVTRRERDELIALEKRA